MRRKDYRLGDVIYNWYELIDKPDIMEQLDIKDYLIDRFKNIKYWIDNSPLIEDNKKLLYESGWGKLEMLRRVQLKYGWEKINLLLAVHRLDFRNACLHLLKKKNDQIASVIDDTNSAKMAYSDLDQVKLLKSLLEAASVIVDSMRRNNITIPGSILTLAASICAEKETVNG
ncbi:MAG: hypothetical protein AABY32_02410 [Nanoarchaeota archaeon]